MSQQDALMQDEDIDVIGIIAQLKKNWWLLIGVPLIVGTLLLVGLSLTTPKYVSSARVLIQERVPFTSTSEDSNRIVPSNASEETVRSQVEVIKSNNLASRVIDDLGLAQYDEFKKNGILSKLSSLMGTGSTSSGKSKALKIFNENLDVYAIDGTTVIVVEYSSPSRDRAQFIVTELLKKYQDYRDNLNQNAAVWLEPKIEELEEQLKKEEREIARIRAAEDLILSDNNALLATEQLSDLSREHSELRAQSSAAKARADSVRVALRNGSSVDVIPEVIDSPLIQRLREREVELRAQISDLSTTLLPNHPQLRALNSQVEDFRRQIRSAASNILASLENNVRTTRDAAADLELEINGLKKEAAKVEKALVLLRPKIQNADSTRELLADYRSRFQEAESREGLDAVEVGIIAEASLPIEPAFPKTIPYTIAGMVAALLLTGVSLIATALLSAASHPRMEAQPVEEAANDIAEAVNDEESTAVENVVEVAPVEAVPVVEAEKPAADEKEDKATITEKLAKVQTEMKIRLREKPEEVQEHILFDAEEELDDEFEEHLPHIASPKLDMSKSDFPITEEPTEFDDSVLAVRYAASVIADLDEARVLVTSPAGNVGSRTAWMLVRSIAKSGKSSLIVDLSGGGVTSIEMLGSKDLHGLYALMSGAVAFNSIVYKDRSSNAHVVPAGMMFPNMPQLNLSSMADVINAISQSYDFVIIDCGDADVNTMKWISSEESIFVISGIGANPSQCNELEKGLMNAGYSDILQIIPDSIDHEKDKVMFA